MPHMLAKLSNVTLDAVKRRLEADAAEHAAEGLFLEHLWQNIDDAKEVFFLFRVADLDRARESVALRHREARKHASNVNLPTLTFLDEIPVFAQTH